MIRKFNEDISNLVIDYNRECISSTLDDVLSYVLEMLPLIGYNKKYIFDRLDQNYFLTRLTISSCFFLNTAHVNVQHRSKF